MDRQIKTETEQEAKRRTNRQNKKHKPDRTKNGKHEEGQQHKN